MRNDMLLRPSGPSSTRERYALGLALRNAFAVGFLQSRNTASIGCHEKDIGFEFPGEKLRTKIRTDHRFDATQYAHECGAKPVLFGTRSPEQEVRRLFACLVHWLRIAVPPLHSGFVVLVLGYLVLWLVTCFETSKTRLSDGGTSVLHFTRGRSRR